MPCIHINLKSIKIIFLLLFTALTLAACSSPSPEPPPPSPQPTEAPEEGQTITIITPDAHHIDTENAPKYQIQTRLTDFELLSEYEGIAWGVTKNALRMYMTRDNGNTWADVSPSPNIQFSSNPVYGQHIFFTDANNGWIVRRSYGMTEAIVLRTTDGGNNWKVSSLVDTNNISSIFFISPKTGWILTSRDSSPYKEGKTMYLTVNGGATWDMIMQNEQYSPKAPNPSIPIPGITTGIIFRNETHGFAVLQTAALPKIYITSDGGLNWRQGQSILVNDHLRSCDRVITCKPDFFVESTKSGWIPVGCQTDKDSSIAYHGYFTSNGGDNWKFAPFNLKRMKGINRNIAPVFLNASMGWALNGNVIYHTTDQGGTWYPLSTSSVLQTKLAEYPEIVKLEFFSENLGWLLIEKKEDKRSILLQTTNGGLSWRVM